MSGFRIRRPTRCGGVDGWGWDLFVAPPPSHQIEGGVFSEKLNRAGPLGKQMPGLNQELVTQLTLMKSSQVVTRQPGEADPVWLAMVIERFDPVGETSTERLYEFPYEKLCVSGSPEARVWELVNSIFDGYKYPTVSWMKKSAETRLGKFRKFLNRPFSKF